MSGYFHRLLDLTGIVSAPPPMEPRPTLADGGVPVAGTGEAPVGADPAQGSGPGPDVVEHVEVLEIGGLGVGSGGLGDPGRAGHGPTLEPGSNRGTEVPGPRSGSADPGFDAASDAREPATVREIATEATTVERIAGQSGPRGVGQAAGETFAVRAEGRRGTVEDGGSVAAAVASTGLPAEVVQAVMRWIAGGSGGGRGAGGREMGPGGQTATRVEDGSGGDGGVPAGGVVAGLEQAERVIMPREEIAGWEREVAEARPVARAAVPEPQAREGSRGGGVEGTGPVRVTIGTVEIRVEAPVVAPMAAAGAARGESAPRRDRDRDREAGARRAAPVSAAAAGGGRSGGAGTRLRRHYILPH